MKSAVRLAIVLALVFCAQAQAQTLVYSLSYSDTAASRRARFANVAPFPGQRTEDENLAILRNTRKTEIYSLSVADGKRALLFSDEVAHLEIAAADSVSSSANAYTKGVLRYFATIPISPSNSAPYRGVKADEGIYELSLDGSNLFRKVANSQNQGRPMLNPQGTKAAVPSSDAESLLIYSVPDWKLLSTVKFAQLSQTHCPGCTPASYGWMADGNRLYIELTVVGEEDDDEAKADHPGTYVVGADGTDLGTISPQIGAFQVAGYVHPKFTERRFLGQLPDGGYLFLDHGAKEGTPLNQAKPFLVISAPDSKLVKAFPLKFAIGTCYIGPSGKYLAYLESRMTPDYRSELHLWVKNLETGEEKELLGTPPPNSPNSPEPNVTLALLGWLN